MDSRSNWQRAAVDLFEKAAARLTGDARQIQESLGWLRRVTPIDSLHGEAHWIREADQAGLKRIV